MMLVVAGLDVSERFEDEGWGSSQSAPNTGWRVVLGHQYRFTKFSAIPDRSAR
jgi:hypothetical protein